MRIQFLNGGLANQVFQYIFARYYELSHPGEVMYLDDSYFALNMVHNGYELEKVFGVKPHMLSECFDEEVWEYMLSERTKGKSIATILNENEIPFYMISESGNYKEFNPFSGKVIEVPCNEYHPEILDWPEDAYYHGYWINKKWFDKYRDVFLKELSFQNTDDPKAKEYDSLICSTHSLAVHVRRGDYVSLKWAYSTEVYRKMIEAVLEQNVCTWHLFVFSDDIEWCKENVSEIGFDKFEAVTFVEGNVHGKNYLDMWLMSHCEGMLVSNSAFCYLAALLNTRLQYYVNLTSREI